MPSHIPATWQAVSDPDSLDHLLNTQTKAGPSPADARGSALALKPPAPAGMGSLPTAPGASAAAAAAAAASDGGHASKSLSRQLAVLFWRTGTDILRNPTLLLLHWVMAAVMGIFVGCIFFNVQLDISGAQNRAGEGLGVGLWWGLGLWEGEGSGWGWGDGELSCMERHVG